MGPAGHPPPPGPGRQHTSWHQQTKSSFHHHQGKTMMVNVYMCSQVNIEYLIFFLSPIYTQFCLLSIHRSVCMPLLLELNQDQDPHNKSSITSKDISTEIIHLERENLQVFISLKYLPMVVYTLYIETGANSRHCSC